MLLNKIKANLKDSILNKNEIKKNTLRMVLGEIPRLNKKANELPTDQEVINIIKKLIKSETITLEASGKNKNESEYIKILESYIPKEMNEEEIKNYILTNIDISAYNPKIKAMGIIMKSLNGKANGNLVRKVLQNL